MQHKCKIEGRIAEDSTKNIVNDTRESTTPLKNFEFAGIFDEEDNCSYLEGSKPFESHESALNLARYQQHPSYEDVELKKSQTIEQIYWPFHRYYDINGLRRMTPKKVLPVWLTSLYM